MNKIARMCVALLAYAFCGVSATWAQAFQDHWTTSDACVAAVGTPTYHPTIIHQQKLAANEVVRGHPTGGCFEMDLPDRIGGRGWVRIEAGREFVYNSLTGEVLRLKECNNHTYHVVPFTLPRDGRDGKDGLNGHDGLNGRNGIDGRDGRDFIPQINWDKEAKMGGGHKLRNTLIVGGAVVGTGVVLCATHVICPQGQKEHVVPVVAYKPPAVTSDSARKCFNGYPPVAVPCVTTGTNPTTGPGVGNRIPVEGILTDAPVPVIIHVLETHGVGITPNVNIGLKKSQNRSIGFSGSVKLSTLFGNRR